MIRWWQDRQLIKHAKETVAAARKLERLHRDILPAADCAALGSTATELESAIKLRKMPAVEASLAKVEQVLEKAFPRQSASSVRENVEVFLVAAIVAMAVRTFFLQPFKIPTGSMQPTLSGIVPATDFDRNASLPTRLWEAVVHGKWPQHPNGSLATTITDFLVWTTFGHVPDNTYCVYSGDHIFVDRFTYHFRQPDRGDVVVFETQFMRERGFDPRGGFYIKRAVAKGGDHVEVKSSQLLIDGEILRNRPIFDRIYSMKDGYNGYELPEPFGHAGQAPAQFLTSRVTSNVVPPNSWLVLGDNTRSSLDGRYWGSVPERAIIGRAVVVYWPLTRAGLIP